MNWRELGVKPAKMQDIPQPTMEYALLEVIYKEVEQIFATVNLFRTVAAFQPGRGKV